MKLLSVTVPCYNSQEYMRNCVDSLLVGGELVEILIVDDGSKDDTGRIADEYAAKYPNIVKAIHQENGGHGEAVNTGIKNATGLYFKVVDSDDWVNAEAYHAILDKLQEIAGGPQVLDMMKKLREQNGTSMLMITHDLGIVAEVCDCVSVIYAGRVVEHGTLEDVFDHTLHPYTKGLFNSLPNMKDRKARLQPIPGLMPDPQF